MKKTLHILLACVLLFSCVKELELPVQPEYGTEAVKTYTLSVEAGKGERPDTKALDIDGTGALNATWAVGEEVAVYKADVLLGTLTARDEGASTTLEGVITGELAVDDELTLKFLSPDYASQDGTLGFIASHCDYAEASVKVNAIVGTVVTTEKAVFQNRQAICTFTLKQGEDDITASITALTITSGTDTYAITRQAAPGPIYVAMKAVSDATIDFAATDGTNYFEKAVTGKTLATGNFYAVTLGMDPGTGMISYVRRSWNETSQSVVSETVVEKATDIRNLSKFTGLSGTYYVSGNLDITGSLFSTHGLTTSKNGTLNLVVCDGADFKCDYIHLSNTDTLRIFGQTAGTGKMTIDASDGAAIGLFDSVSDNGGTMEFHGGVIYTKGGPETAAIGSYEHYWGRMAFYGGTVTAYGGSNSAGIGRSYTTGDKGGVIDIYGGTIKAYGGAGDEGGMGGSGIGEGLNSQISAVNIYGGTIVAEGYFKRAGISATKEGEGTVNISGGKVTTTGGSYYPGILFNTINISGGEVSAYAGVDAAAIGGKEGGNGGVINISGGTVRAYANNREDSYGAGIGGGQNGSGGTITISGGTVYAYGGTDAAGIGSGDESGITSITSGNITITGGWVYAVGKGKGAGIGAGEDALCTWVNIYSSSGNPLHVEAIGGDQCGDEAGSIGAYREADFGNINIGPHVRVQTYNNTTLENLETSDNRVDRIHHRRRAILFTCTHEGYSEATCPYCTHTNN